jgi:hypothetical protein
MMVAHGEERNNIYHMDGSDGRDVEAGETDEDQDRNREAPYCTTPLRYVGGAYRLDNFLDDPLTFADRAEADKLASHWNDNQRGDGQAMTVSLSVEDFYDAFPDELDSSLLFIEQELA